MKFKSYFVLVLFLFLFLSQFFPGTFLQAQEKWQVVEEENFSLKTCRDFALPEKREDLDFASSRTEDQKKELFYKILQDPKLMHEVLFLKCLELEKDVASLKDLELSDYQRAGFELDLVKTELGRLTKVMSEGKSLYTIGEDGFIHTGQCDLHTLRRISLETVIDKEVLKELKKPDSREGTAIMAATAAQVGIAYVLNLLNQKFPGALTSTWTPVVVGWALGGLLNQHQIMGIHEAAHQNIYDKPWKNTWIARLANIPLIIPFADKFVVDHLPHHKFLGVQESTVDHPADNDLPTVELANWVKNSSWKKLFWATFYGPMYFLTRKHQAPTSGEMVNFLTQMAANVGLYYLVGGPGLTYLMSGALATISLHPVSGHWWDEHYPYLDGGLKDFDIILDKLDLSKSAQEIRDQFLKELESFSLGEQEPYEKREIFQNMKTLAGDDRFVAFLKGVKERGDDLSDHVRTLSPATRIQETNSYYGPLNKVSFNVGHHVEHHDMVNVPGYKIPEMRGLVPWAYDGLRSTDSWSKRMWDFIWDPKQDARDRVVRKKEELIENKMKGTRALNEYLNENEAEKAERAKALLIQHSNPSHAMDQ